MTFADAIIDVRDALDAYARDRTDRKLVALFGAFDRLARAHDGSVLERSLERRERARRATARRASE